MAEARRGRRRKLHHPPEERKVGRIAASEYPTPRVPEDNRGQAPILGPERGNGKKLDEVRTGTCFGKGEREKRREKEGRGVVKGGGRFKRSVLACCLRPAAFDLVGRRRLQAVFMQKKNLRRIVAGRG